MKPTGRSQNVYTVTPWGEQSPNLPGPQPLSYPGSQPPVRPPIELPIQAGNQWQINMLRQYMLQKRAWEERMRQWQSQFNSVR